ncbi:hypothetical protein DV738_g612, partial [Chaetothyriales sp. CBS 135597]
MAQASGHVPAWKRLGLKLKYAKEEVLDSDSPPVNRPHTAKSDETNGISKPKPKSKSKKSDLNGHSSPPAPTSNGSVAPTLNGHRDDGPPPAKKQKRVSFSPDTKLLDGDGEGASTARHAVAPSELANGGPSSSSTTPPSKHKSQKMLDYLHLYYNEHANWKFQKNREVWILKHALSTEAIGTKEYGLALAQYVNDQAAQQQTNNVLAVLSRPLLILAALYPDRDSYRPARRETPPAQNGDSSKRTAAETAKSKKKKNRTVVVEYSREDSSSSDDSS